MNEEEIMLLEYGLNLVEQDFFKYPYINHTHQILAIYGASMVYWSELELMLQKGEKVK